MNCLGKIAFCLASSVAWAGFCAIGPATSANPYDPIVVRNVFDLNPPQPVGPIVPDTPVKITPDGIMTIFGSKQVLFYADIPPRPPIPATQKSYILSEGQQQDDIEVKRIDEGKGIITFSNHGVLQEIPLAKAGPITTPTPVVMNTAYNPSGAPANIRGPAGNTGNLASRFGQNRNFASTARSFGNAGNTAGNIGNTGLGNTSVGGGNGASQQQLTPEQQMLMIVAQKAQAKQAGNPIWKIFPPTSADQEAGTVNSAPAPGNTTGP